MTLKQFALAGFALTLASAASAQALKPEDAIKFRKSGYAFMAWNMGKIKAQVVDGAVPYNKDQVLAAARVVAATANSGMGALYGPGTDKEVGGQATRVKPELFQQQEEVGKLARAYIQEATKLAEVAASGDQAAVKAQFGKTGEACKACHDKYRKD